MREDEYLDLSSSSDKITLPQSSNRNLKSKISKKKRKLKWGFIILFIVLIYLFYNHIILFFLEILKTNPTIFSYYLYFEDQIINNTLSGLFFISILGSLFFLVIPSEALFIYYLSSTTHSFLLIILIMVVGNLVGLIFNYFFGRMMGERVLKFIFNEKKYLGYEEKINNIGKYILFFGNIFPGPIEALTVFFGGFKFKFSKYVLMCFLGRLVKYIILFILFYFYWDTIIFTYSDFLEKYF